MRTIALTRRIIRQIFHDKRTIALILIAPIVIITLIYFVLNAQDTAYTIGIVNTTGDNSAFVTALENSEDYTVSTTAVSADEASAAVKSGTLDGAASVSGNDVTIWLSGADSSVAGKVEMLIKSAYATAKQDQIQADIDSMNQKMDDLESTPQGSLIASNLDLPDISYSEPVYTVDYVTGKADSSLFEKFGTQLIGIVVYFFVFLIAGINFLTERTSGTLEKLLTTPVRRWEIILGYILGYSLLALIQAALISVYVVYVLGLTVAGSFWYVLLVCLLTAVNALSLGILLSTMAGSEFQMMQFIPIVILPQFFLCGLFRMSGAWSTVADFIPLHYTSHALTAVMINGQGWTAIWSDILWLTGVSVLFVAVNVLLLKRQRRI
ncbi:MAG: ABC transporter permease [Eubacteriaceae bacterium]|jgi:ABC-2 type transport system permease protein